MFNTTILNNIKLNRNVIKSDIEEVAKKANCLEFIQTLSN
jgi:ABC-type multidrug transport system fused ATPase/permease subunit